eukprot:1140553-Pelagomonas_calceolata.AAC.7
MSCKRVGMEQQRREVCSVLCLAEELTFLCASVTCPYGCPCNKSECIRLKSKRPDGSASLGSPSTGPSSNRMIAAAAAAAAAAESDDSSAAEDSHAVGARAKTS